MPCRIHTILTDNTIQFAEQPRNRNTICSRPMRFDMICEANGIEHRLTRPNHPWTSGQVEQMNRTIKDVTVKQYHYDSHDLLRCHPADFLNAYNFARRLKTLSSLTPYKYSSKIWTSEPEQFILNTILQMTGMKNQPAWDCGSCRIECGYRIVPTRRPHGLGLQVSSRLAHEISLRDAWRKCRQLVP
ncbi:MAG: integrase core domain-containing protein [Paracoccus sp. (in: a-proteobacteria)]